MVTTRAALRGTGKRCPDRVRDNKG